MTQQKSPITIAVVEDNESILDAVTLVLENQEWNVAAYTTGEAFLDDLHDYRPDLLLLDSHLPGINGVEVIEAISDDPVTLPTIILTAHPYSEHSTRLNHVIGGEMLIKPVTESQLVNRVRAALAKPQS